MNEELEPYTDPGNVSYMETGIPGYKVPVHKAVLTLRPKAKRVAVDLDAIWEIIKDLSECNGTEHGSVGRCCIFCNALDDSLSNLRHEDTCIISKAYRLVWQREGLGS